MTTGESPDFDVFISYRVSSDKQHALKLFDSLTAKCCKVWLDSVRLKVGKVIIIFLLNIYYFIIFS